MKKEKEKKKKRFDAPHCHIKFPSIVICMRNSVCDPKSQTSLSLTGRLGMFLEKLICFGIQLLNLLRHQTRKYEFRYPYLVDDSQMFNFLLVSKPRRQCDRFLAELKYRQMGRNINITNS